MMIPQVPILVHFFMGKKKSVTDYLIINLTTHTYKTSLSLELPL